MFLTLQGEGQYAGRRAVFIRFAGCNLWSGDPKHRARDAARNHASCPLFCDTEFRGGTKMTAEQVVRNAKDLGAGGETFVVLTGGEPMLQVDLKLLKKFRDEWVEVHVETNGSVKILNGNIRLIKHLVVSPKQDKTTLRVSRCDELKVVVPRYDPLAYAGVFIAKRLTVQPEEDPDPLVWKQNIAFAKEFILANPKWYLSLQVHKYLGVQ